MFQPNMFLTQFAYLFEGKFKMNQRWVKQLEVTIK